MTYVAWWTYRHQWQKQTGRSDNVQTNGSRLATDPTTSRFQIQTLTTSEIGTSLVHESVGCVALNSPTSIEGGISWPSGEEGANCCADGPAIIADGSRILRLKLRYIWKNTCASLRRVISGWFPPIAWTFFAFLLIFGRRHLFRAFVQWLVKNSFFVQFSQRGS